MIFLLVHLPSSFESASVEERRSEVWASARLRARAVDTPPKDCPGPKCKSSAAGGSANEEESVLLYKARSICLGMNPHITQEKTIPPLLLV
ncbi:hypothetical protein PGTUg99_036300 [Puccinia graminis f. sp. tritici]|uniref:Uncharacterized protein n=1 Tax=Puccinia graminis f. sp. tritici TaxID=56615 RepID=A0A5B0SGE2_PUCGR|nr:hypothetical protein PGTUg99_036300 [Puccinia graminis f. sp. tritici]